jgi:Uncharacterized protein family UPF0016
VWPGSAHRINAVVGSAFALTFLAELPDKSMFAALVLGTRYRPACGCIGPDGTQSAPAWWLRPTAATTPLVAGRVTTRP